MLFIELFFTLVFSIFEYVSAIDPSFQLVPLDLSSRLNHRAFGNGADVDGLGHHFIAKQHEPHELSVGGGAISFSSTIGISQYDNICIQGNDQQHTIFTFSTSANTSSTSLGALYLLVTSSHGAVVADVSVTYQESSSSTVSRLVIPDWQEQQQDLEQVEKWDSIARSVSNTQNIGGIYSIPVYIDPAKTPIALSVSLPTPSLLSTSSRDTNDRPSPSVKHQKSFAPSVHIFAATAILSPSLNSATSIRALQMTTARGTRRFWNDETALIPVVLVRLHNVGSQWLDDLTVFVTSRQGQRITTLYPGKLGHLAPGHVFSLDVGIQILFDDDIDEDDDSDMDDIQVQVKTSQGDLLLQESSQLSLSFYRSSVYQATKSSLLHHQAPTWYQQAKFGIFIHWGLYSVPAWAPVGKQYAEWYWWYMNQQDSPTFDYHRRRYGQGFAYDDFIPLWQPTLFDPRTWLDLIDASRAKYFVFTSKHHDGFALFDTKVTNRSSVRLQPHRDFVHDLITASKEHYPHLKRGIYFSMPEWYHPDHHDPEFPDWHGPPFNPYTNKTLIYTGSPRVKDFVNDLQLPQLLELVNSYEPDILWCDIGGINNSTVWQAEYFNKAAKQNRQVTINDRCGNGVSDFTTLEYQETATPPSRSWESTRGIDPKSFGFNQATPPKDYATTEDLLHELVDTVSMGGNFLLNVGPSANGTIFHTMVERLHDIGRWLDVNGASIFQAKPYWMTTQDDRVKFMMGDQLLSFYILVLDESAFDENKDGTKELILTTPLPLRPSSTNITLLNAPSSAPDISWSTQQHGQGSVQYIISGIPEDATSRVQYVWVFQCTM